MKLNVYPEALFQKLEFDQVLQLIVNNCVSEQAREDAVALQPIADRQQLTTALQEAWEMYNLLQFDSPLPEESIPHIKTYLRIARIEGNFFDEEQCVELLKILSYAKRLIGFFASRKEQYPALWAIAATVAPGNQAIALLEAVIGKEGKVKPNASKTLSDISGDLNRLQQDTRRKLDTILRQAKANGWAAETGATIRDGRLVLPILAEHKRKIKGFIHDESATGQTVYLEPAELLEHNNDIRNLELAYRREIRRILIQLTTDLRPYLGDLEGSHALAARFDLLRAGGLLARRYPIVARPAIRKKPGFRYTGAFHPLLWLHHQAQGKKVVPLDLMLDGEKHILVVSGPNAGGKSVSLKTIGLLQLMGQSGLLLPVAEGSEIGIFEQLLVDLGDEQSIENDLSTYSSHLTNMRHFTEYANDKTLFLIDEFGTGTDPALGGPIAEAILEKMHSLGAYGMVNTHYSNLKLLAGRLSGLLNGAMGFDTHTLEPRYKLEIGKPGSSFAFEIAGKIGLSPEIIAAARAKIGIQQQDVEVLLVQLEQEKAEIDRYKRLMEEKDRMLDELLSKTETREQELKQQKRRILEVAREEAAALLHKANKEIENTIREIKEAAADREITKAARNKLELVKDEVQQATRSEKLEEKQSQQKEKAELQLTVGGHARIRDTQTIGVVVSLGKNDAELSVGDLRMSIKKNRLEPVSASDARRQQRASGSSVKVVAGAISGFSPKLDLRGFRGQEALQELDRFLDKAVMSGYGRLELLHGKGDGILRKLIREHLKKQRFVAAFESEHADRGGDGITLVELK